MAEDFRAEYNRRLPIYKRLEDEIVFSLNDAFTEADIRTHGIPSRVKSAQSLASKAVDKGWTEPFEMASDVVGARVVVLFGSDLEPARKVIRNTFAVAKEETIGSEEPARFGYSGIHFDASIRETDTGRRYRGLHELRFEVQLRTIVEDAWAAVSHVLGYKGPSSIPQNLQRDFYALSGLFYVADQHFELFYKQAEQAGAQADRAVADGEAKRGRAKPIPLNANTLVALLNRRYPDRVAADRADASELIPDLEAHGLTALHEVIAMLERTQDAFERYETANPPGPEGEDRFHRIGVARISLALASKDFRYRAYDIEDPEVDDDMLGFALDYLAANYD